MDIGGRLSGGRFASGRFAGGRFGLASAWSPASLGKSSVAPFWDIYGTNYQDTAGQTLAEDVTDPVALMLDGAEKGALGAEQVPTGDMSDDTGWVLPSGWSMVGGKLIAVGVGSNVNAECPQFTTVVGEVYSCAVGADAITSGSFRLYYRDNTGASYGEYVDLVAGETTPLTFIAQGTNTELRVYSLSAGSSGEFDSLTAKQVLGYHASQAVTANQPMVDETTVDNKAYGHLTFDFDDDLEVATLADMGADATKWTANIAGVSIEEGLTIGAGAYTLPTKDWGAHGVVDRALTTSEVNKLLTWAQKNHTPAQYATMKTRMDVIMMNAVDAVIYDPLHDSDGGIIALAAGVPGPAVCIAEATSVKIYDGSDPTLPLWKTYDFSGYVVSSVATGEQYLVVGTASGVAKLDIVNDSAVTITHSTATSPAIVNDAVNDVALVALSGAGTDATTGLKEITAAAGIDGGISVINDDGTVADSASTDNWVHVEFDEGGTLFGMESSGVDDINAFTSYASDGFTIGSGRQYYGGSIPALLSNVVNGMLPYAIAHDVGLTLLDEDTATPANGMVAYITDTYNTGWMQGDCELALCDGLTDRSVTGTTVTDNGTAVIAAIADGAEQKKITATGGSITAPVTTGGAIYGWEEIAGTLYYRNNSGWVGVSESGGTLTIADGTTFAVLRYTNGAGPSAAQFTKSEAEETPLTLEKSACLLNGASPAVNAIANDVDLNLRHVGQSDGTSIFRGLERVSENSNAVTTTIDVVSGMVAAK